jgi:hypothetical protein
MGAWTSTFTIGVSNRLYPPFLQLKDTFQSTYEESEGFEPPALLQAVVFKTTSIDHSDNSPYTINIIRKSYISYLHVLKDSNLYLRFWRPICYHCTKDMCVEIVGIEPTTPVVSERCSNQLSYISICGSGWIRTTYPCRLPDLQSSA